MYTYVGEVYTYGNSNFNLLYTTVLSQKKTIGGFSQHDKVVVKPFKTNDVFKVGTFHARLKAPQPKEIRNIFLYKYRCCSCVPLAV